MNTTETVTGTIASVSAATGATIDVTVNTISGSGTFIAVDPGDGNSAFFSSLSSAISTAGTYYFVTGDIAAGATGTVQGVIVGNSSLTLNYGTLSGTITNAVLSTGTSPLPVEMTSFTASPVNNAATLTWQTATEVNNYGFEIERRVVGQTFISDVIGWSKIGFVAGNGTSNSGHSYSYTDNTAPSGTFAYRLKQIDNNGTFKYSQSTELTIAVPKEFTLGQNYPNPFNPSTTIKYDILGREVATLVNETKEAGSYEVKFNASKLSSGVYFYRLQAGNFASVKKLILLR